MFCFFSSCCQRINISAVCQQFKRMVWYGGEPIISQHTLCPSEPQPTRVLTLTLPLLIWPQCSLLLTAISNTKCHKVPIIVTWFLQPDNELPAKEWHFQSTRVILVNHVCDVVKQEVWIQDVPPANVQQMRDGIYWPICHWATGFFPMLSYQRLGVSLLKTGNHCICEENTLV